MTTELTVLSDVVCRGVPVGGARLRGLLALLAGRLGPGCGTGALVDALWPDDPPRHPVKALQILVSRARAELGADLIVRTATGYRLALTDAQVDVAAVLRHAAAADRVLGGDALPVRETGAARRAEAGEDERVLTAYLAWACEFDGFTPPNHSSIARCTDLVTEREVSAASRASRSRSRATPRPGSSLSRGSGTAGSGTGRSPRRSAPGPATGFRRCGCRRRAVREGC
ncbi:AfsR/SARP family transcriptional regulator [Micromonospora aurantiaca (nom. illeg.)]|uniref:AfsR/SARP family transcriptional regulator n=1 Tax=Micromonospora aurantiaca (nom. illeg.) TaxID=47850 RepID=UPI003F49F030